MNLKAVLFSAATAVFAVPAVAQTQDRIDLFRSLIAENGCAMTEDTAEDFLPQYGFNRDETSDIAGQLISAGSAEFSNGTFVLMDGDCANGGEEAGDLTGNIEQFIGIISGYGCEMAEADAETIFPANGMNKPQVLEVVNHLMSSGMATFSNGRLTVDPAFCQSGAAQEAPVTPTTMAWYEQDDVMLVLSTLTQHECRVSAADIGSVFANTGIEQARVFEIANLLVAEGLATMSGGVLEVSSDACQVVVDQPVTVDQPVSGDLLSRADVVAFLMVMESNNCAINAGDVNSTFAGGQIDSAAAFGIINELVAASFAEILNGSDLVISDAICRPANPVYVPVTPDQPVTGGITDRADVREFLTVLGDNGCTINANDIGAAFSDTPLDSGAAFAIANELSGQGLAEISGSTLSVAASICPLVQVTGNDDGPVVNDDADIAAVPLLERADVNQFIGILADNGCAVAANDVGGVFGAGGMDGAVAFAIANELMNAGIAELQNGNMLVIDGDACHPSDSGGITIIPEPVEETADPVEETQVPGFDAPQNISSPIFDNPNVRQFLAILSSNGCVVEKHIEGSDLFINSDMGTFMAALTALQLQNIGVAGVDYETYTYSVGAPYCVEGMTFQPEDASAGVEAGHAADMAAAEAEAAALQAEIEAEMAAAMAARLAEAEAEEAAELAAAEAAAVPSFVPAADIDSPIFGNPNVVQFIEIIAANGCYVDYAEFEALFADGGMSSFMANLTFHQLNTVGAATVDYDDWVYIVGAPYCVAQPGAGE